MEIEVDGTVVGSFDKRKDVGVLDPREKSLRDEYWEQASANEVSGYTEMPKMFETHCSQAWCRSSTLAHWS